MLYMNVSARTYGCQYLKFKMLFRFVNSSHVHSINQSLKHNAHFFCKYHWSQQHVDSSCMRTAYVGWAFSGLAMSAKDIPSSLGFQHIHVCTAFGLSMCTCVLQHLHWVRALCIQRFFIIDVCTCIYPANPRTSLLAFYKYHWPFWNLSHVSGSPSL